ncbi:hypothetical protein M885DRAFT_585552 [Pelagophyceae sp. CCMP2097]|nr:hypothetical protein M885DRAFT_585552 [Pelagophyceae sp. CCMP2097]
MRRAFGAAPRCCVVSLDDLVRGLPSAKEALITSLRSTGSATLRCGREEAEELRASVNAFSCRRRFRGVEAQPAAVSVLARAAAAAAHAVVGTPLPPQGWSLFTRRVDAKATSGAHSDCGPDGSGLDGSSDGETYDYAIDVSAGPLTLEKTFADSFFNAFNFDHGFLNAHVDRGLLTAIYGRSDAGDESPRVRLWLRPAGQDWNAVNHRDDDFITLLVGAQLEALSQGHFKAVDHAVTVDPFAPRLDSTLPRHPDALPYGNRKSMALVLALSDAALADFALANAAEAPAEGRRQTVTA